MYASNFDWTATTAGERTNRWSGALTSVTQPGFAATVENVYYLHSHYQTPIGMSPIVDFVMPTRYGEPSVVHSWGDFGVSSGDYKYRSRLPSDTEVFPNKFRATDNKDSYLRSAREYPEGRAFVVDMMAEQGDYIVGVATTIDFPAHEDGLTATSITDIQGESSPKWKGAILKEGNQFGVYWCPGTRYQSALEPALAHEEHVTVIVSFHVPVPSPDCWVEGFGIVAERTHEGVRPPMVASLWMQGGLTRGGARDRYSSATTKGYVHRLEVETTDGKPMQIDSAGGGSVGQGLVFTDFAPAWAPTGKWAPFDPLLLLRDAARVYVLYVSIASSARVPQAGDTIRTLGGNGPVRSAAVSYAEKIGYSVSGPTEETTAYRIYVPVSDELGTTAGYPHGLVASSQVPDPTDIPYLSMDAFQEGELVQWEENGGGDTGTGVVRMVDTYTHGPSLRIKVHMNVYHGSGNVYYFDKLYGAYVRFRCRNLTMSRH